MAKAYFKYGIGAMSGELAEAVHWPTKSRINGYVRRWVMPRLTDNNTAFGLINTNLGGFWSVARAAWKADMKTYTERYYSEAGKIEYFDPCKSPYAMFIKMMWAWHYTDPETIDLANVTVADVIALDADVKEVTLAVIAGYLPTISLHSDLDELIQTGP